LKTLGIVHYLWLGIIQSLWLVFLW